MQRFASYALALAFLLAAVAAQAQTVRFTTSVGAFDMILNPTNDANLQPLVDNMLANVAAGVFHDNWVNRAAPGFVLQLGSFTIDTVDVDRLTSVPPSNVGFEPITVDDDGNAGNGLNFEALSNTRGTVSLALQSGNPNSGSASFFVNVGDNSNLDAQGFVPFAFVEDMTVVDQIMAAPRVDAGPLFGQAPGQLPFRDAPTGAGGDLIIVESAGVVSSDPVSFVDPLLSAVSSIEATAATSSSANSEAIINALTIEDDVPLSPTTDFGFAESEPSSSSAIPEPGSAALVALALGSIVPGRRR